MIPPLRRRGGLIRTILSATLGTALLSGTVLAQSPCKSVRLSSDIFAVNGERFGAAVDIDGDTIVVSAPEAFDPTRGSFSGAVFIFTRQDNGTPTDFTDDTWTQTAKLYAPPLGDAYSPFLFGFSVAISGDFLAVVDGFGSYILNDNYYSGLVHVYSRLGAVWSLEETIVAPGGGIENAEELFSASVALDGTRLLIGAQNNRNLGPAVGAAYVFERFVAGNGTPNWDRVTTLYPVTPVEFAQFGWAVALDGDFAAVGAPFDVGGSAVVFRRTGPTTWVPDTSLPPPGESILFGWSLGLRGNRLMIGAPRQMTSGLLTGAVYSYVRNPGAMPPWVPDPALIAPTDAAAEDRFGTAVRIGEHGAIVGAPGASTFSGAAYVFRAGTMPSWVQADKLGTITKPPGRQLGDSIAADGPFAVIGAPFQDNIGAVYVFAVSDSDNDSTSDSCEGLGIGEELEAPPGADPLRTSLAPNAVQPPSRAFFYNNVYASPPSGRFFANEEGLVTIAWRDINGNPVGSPLTYLIGRHTASSSPNKPYDIAPVKYFRDWPSAIVSLTTSATLTIRYNGTILFDGDAQLPGLQPHIQVQGGQVSLAGNCPTGTVIFQFTDGPNGRLLGFEVVNIIDLGSPAGLPIPVGRPVPTPGNQPRDSFCNVAMLANVSEAGFPVAWQNNARPTDVFPIRDELNPARFILGWYQPTPFLNCWPENINRYITQWPADPQRFAVVTAETDEPLVDLRIGSIYCGADVMYQEGFGATPPAAQIISGRFKAEREGYTTLRLRRQPPGGACGDEVNFEVIASYDHFVPRGASTGVYAGQFDWTIGRQIEDPDHDSETPLFPFGYLRAGRPYAPEIYAETGQIIPVNASDLNGLLEAWWFAESPYAPGTFWPHKTATYFAEWPEPRGFDDEIVIASRLGAGSYPPNALIYEGGPPGSNPGQTGWNPNDEHALLLPIAGSLRAFAVRDDNPRNATSGHPFVLVKYKPGGSNLFQMDVWRVVGERPPYDFDYDAFPSQNDPTTLVPVVAGLPVDPLFPVNFGAAACRTLAVPPVPLTRVVGDALWVDRTGGIWAVEQTHDTPPMGPSIATIFLYENWAADGGCQPWRGFHNGGNGTQPWPIVYRPQWPLAPPDCNYPEDGACARPLSIGASVDVSGQCGALAVLHDSVGQRIIDPTFEVQVQYPMLASDVDFAKLPPHLVGGQIGGGGSAVPDRIRYFDGVMTFRGIMSPRDREILRSLSVDAGYRSRIDTLYPLSRNQLITPLTNPAEKFVTVGDVDARPGWITLAFQNDRACDPLPVSAEVWRVDCPPDRGRINVVQPTCPFNEKQVLQFSGDAGGEPERLVYQWQWSTSPDGPWADYSPPPGPEGCSDAARNCYRHGLGLREVIIEGASPFTLADSWWRVRVRGYLGCPGGFNPDPQDIWPLHLNPGNNTDISEWTEPQLAEGWVKRVVRGINPFDQRVADFHSSQVATFVSMIQQAGMRFEAPVPLNCTPSNINNLGLIEVYETVLRRARQFSIDSGLSYDPANLAILLVSARIADLFMLLGNEAFADAADPTIGLFVDQGPSPDTYDPHAIFCFQNQMASLLDEELALLRGRDQVRPPDVDLSGRRQATVYNRLPWNFTSGDGQVAYANNYQVTRLTDINPLCGTQGHSSCAGARDLYPQGHGDAWGHYLTAVKKFYALLRHPTFEWVVSTEAVLVGGQPVNVGFEYERRFARAAAARARTGAAITSLTFRQLYSADPVQQDGYPDADPNRAWGVSDWGKRAGMGAYFDWITVNALLDDNDTDPTHLNTIRKIDRTTVPEITEIAHAFQEIQSIVDQADAGLNPLGLATNVVPFGLNPAEIDQGKTHFDQIFERALASLNGAVTAFNFANQNTQRLRSDQDQQQRFSDLASERERDLNGRLIEIFGRPYPEDVGPGRTYPAGYNGPDVYHFAYVEPTELIGQTNQSRTTTVSRSFLEREVGPQGEITEATRIVQFNVSTDGLGLVKPAGWGARPEPGDLQLSRAELLQSLGRLLQTIERYEAQIDDIEDQLDLLESVFQINRQRLSVLYEGQMRRKSLQATILEARENQQDARRNGTLTRALADGASEMLPKVAGLAGDFTSAVRGALKVAASIAGERLDASADSEALDELRAEQDLQILASEQQIRIEDINDDERVEQLTASIRQMIRGLPALRVEILTLREAVNQATGRYHAALGRGLRLLEERTAFRQKTANQVSEYRYRDMAFRIFRNQALQKYRAQFDLAARYAFLAAKAYDYETNLLGADPEAGRRYLTGLTRERVLGVVNGQTPLVGTGLAGQLATMLANWQAIRPQLGFNAPAEINRTFSLRWELFRLPNSIAFDAEWRSRLSAAVVPDLNAVQEYTQYCQPLQPPIANNPAIVLPFATTVQSQLNLFGWPSTGDATLPSDRFAIKLHSHAVRFSNYPGFPLNRQINVYLVPVGADVMRVPLCPIAPTRQWHLLDQTLPVPFPISAGNLTDPNWLPWNSLNGGPASLVRRRLIPTVAACATDDAGCTDVSFKLTGRSIWNTRWLLIIPGSELQGSDPANGVNVFINGNTASGIGVRDIKLPVKAYGYSGCALSALDQDEQEFEEWLEAFPEATEDEK